jgi:hypothetical protein
VRLRVLPLPRSVVDLLPDYIPMNCGDGPVVMRPWDDGDSVASRRGAHDWQPHGGDPMRNAPRTDPDGGVVYFDAGESREPLKVLFKILGIRSFLRDYAVGWADSDDFARDGYLTCLRIISRRALAQLDRQAAAGLHDQGVYVDELLHSFVDDELRHYGPEGNGYLGGTLGGDGDWAYEELAFGIMVENSCYRVYRIWSRPWLVAK